MDKLTWITCFVSLLLCSGIQTSSATLKCSPSPPLNNGYISSKWDGYILQFHCHQGYQLQGAATVLCRNGRWNHPAPKCVTGGFSQQQQMSQMSESTSSQRYGVVRSLTDAQYQQNYDLPTSETLMSSSRLSLRTKRPLFSWDGSAPSRHTPTNGKQDDAAKNDEQTTHGERLLAQSLNKQPNVNQMATNRVRRKKIKKQSSTTALPMIDNLDAQNVPKKKSNRDNLRELRGKSQDPPMKSDVRGEKCPKDDGQCRYVYMNYSDIQLGQLDMSCMVNETTFLEAPKIRHGVIDVYRRRHNPEEPFNNYLEAFYVCRKDYLFQNSIAHSLYCLQGKWVGQLPHCVNKATQNKTPLNSNAQTDTNLALTEANDDDPEMGNKNSCKINKGGCQQVCEESDSDVRCQCYRGYRLNDDKKTCTDVNECDINNGGCQYQCWNIPGSFKCYCTEGYNLGSDRKTCIDKNECLLNNGHGPCQDGCRNLDGGYQCHCSITGTQLSADNHTCEDIDECTTDNFGCAHSCLNTIGTAFCACSEGYMLGEDWKSCEDVDECEFPEIATTCQNGCENTVGSYRCLAIGQPTQQVVETDPMPTDKPEPQQQHCDNGFTWSEMQHQCIDVDECSLDNYGCSHYCNNVPGSATCSCPIGWLLLEDWKTCEDIDECTNGNLQCGYQCVNTNGSGHCICPRNYLLLSNGQCEDVNECLHHNGYCSQICVNFDGGHRCECNSPYTLSGDGRSCQVPYCMMPPEPLRGKVKCDHELEELQFFPVNTNCHVICDKDCVLVGEERFHCLMNGEWSSLDYKCDEPKLCPKLSNPVNGHVTPPSCLSHLKEEGELCYFECDEGYVLKGNSRRICGPTQQWDPQETPECVQLIEERVDLECPNTVTYDLPKNRKNVFLKLPHPTTNIDFRLLTVFPSWIQNYQGFFPSGTTLITVRAVHPITRISKSCSFQVNVRDIIPPIVYNCPEPITNVVIDDDSDTAVVNWEEPNFVDNVGIVSIWKSREQGTRLPPGIHHVRYVARDAAGNTGNCGFSFQVLKVPKLSREEHVMPLGHNQQLAPQNLFYAALPKKDDCKLLQKRHTELLHAFRVAIKRGCIKNSENFLAALTKGNVPPTTKVYVRSYVTPTSYPNNIDNNAQTPNKVI